MKVYVSKESKKEETKSTAYSFLLVSVFGFIALILFATGVLPVHVADYMKIMLCIVMGAMLLIFFVIGIVSLRQLKTLGTQAEKENDSEEAAAEQSLIPAIEIAPVTGVDSLDKTELKLEMS